MDEWHSRIPECCIDSVTVAAMLISICDVFESSIVDMYLIDFSREKEYSVPSGGRLPDILLELRL